MQKARPEIKAMVLVALLFITFSACSGPASPAASSTSSPVNTPTTTPVIPTSTSSLAPTYTPTLNPYDEPEPQGLSPHAIAITQNGEYAYVGFDLSEVVFRVRLSDLAVVAEADLSRYFPIESEGIALDESETKLFVSSPTWGKLIVLDTQTMNIIHVVDDIGNVSMLRSQYGPTLIAWSGGNAVKFINTQTYEVTEFVDPDEFFVKIQESYTDQDLWVVVSGKDPGDSEVNAGIYNYKTKTWSHKISLPPEARAGTVHDLEVLPDEQKAYVAIMGGWYPEYHAYGWLDSVDLVSEEVRVVPIDGGAMCLAASPDSQRLYVGTGWPIPAANNLLVVDTQSDKILGLVSLGQTQYGWNYTQMNDLQIDPADPQVLYATSTDGNAIIKVNLESLTLSNVHVFNQESFRPHFFVRQPGQAAGFILIHQSPYAFELDLDQAAIKAVVKFPDIRQDAGNYDIAINEAGKILIPQGEYVLEVNPEDMSLLGQHQLPNDVGGLWSFVFSHDQASLFSIWPGPASGGWPPDTFLRINASSFQVEAKVKLEGGSFNSIPFELPDSSKLYALGGMPNGAVVIQVIDLENNTLERTITFDEPGLQGISAGTSDPIAYDPNSHTLYVGATQVVLAIDTDTDTIKKVIHLGDAATAIGIEPGQLTYGNAVGLVYNPRENYLYIAHVDRSFISIYDLENDRFLPQVIPLKGYFPSFIFANDDYSRIYSLNGRSDSVSVINVTTKAVEKVIDLHSYLPEP